MNLRQHDNQNNSGMNTLESAIVAFAFNEPSFWIYFILLGLIALYSAWAGSMIGVGLSIGAILGAITGRASMTNGGEQ